MTEPRLVMVGCGGHARVLIDALALSGSRITAIIDASVPAGRMINGIEVIGNDDCAADLDINTVLMVNGVGAQPFSRARESIHQRYGSQEFRFATVQHPSSAVAHSVVLREGSQIMAGAVVQSWTDIGAGVIVNSRASVDHDCVIGEHAFIGPGVVICGGVHIGEGAFIGAGTIVGPGVRIGARAVVGAATLVRSDVPERLLCAGNPMRVIRAL